MPSGNFNLEDPAKQEAIRRKPHEYVRGDGRHGVYVDKPYLHEEYPKFMDQTPAPAFAEFAGKPNAQTLFDEARIEWERKVCTSVVRNKEQEKNWLEKHKPTEGADATAKGKGKAAA